MKKAIDVAKYILRNSSKCLSNLELQKTLYFAELDFQKECGKRLIEDDFEAWQYGPVSREVYYEYRGYGASSITRPEDEINLGLDNKEKEVLNKSILNSNNKTYWELVEASHKEGGAWKKTYKNGEKNKIKQEDILNEAKGFNGK